MHLYPGNSFRINRRNNPSCRHKIPVGIVFRVAGDDAADMHAAGGVDEVAVAEMNTHVAGPLRRVPEEEQVAFFEVLQPADIDRLAVLHLLGCVAGQDDPLCIEHEFGKPGAVDGFA